MVSSCSRALPVPRTTQRKGSSAILNFTPVSCVSLTSSRSSKRAAAGQVDAGIADIGGELGRDIGKRLTDAADDLLDRQLQGLGMSSGSRVISAGKPRWRSRPLMWIGMRSPFDLAMAQPDSFLMASALVAPISRLYLKRT